MDPCRQGSLPFPAEGREALFEEPPLDLADPPLAYLALGVRGGAWGGPALLVHGPSGHSLALRGRRGGEPLEAWPQPPYRRKCLWVPPACPRDAYWALAERLLGLKEGEEALVNVLPRPFMGMAGSRLGDVYVSMAPGTAVSMDEEYGERLRRRRGGFPASMGALRYGLEEGLLVASLRGCSYGIPVGDVEEAEFFSLWARIAAGDALYYLTPAGIFVRGSGRVEVRHALYNPMVAWMHPYAVAEERVVEGEIEAWWVSVCGRCCVSLASQGGVRVSLRGGAIAASPVSGDLVVAIHRGVLGAVEAAVRARCAPEEARLRPGLPLPVWRLDASGVVVYDAWLDGGELVMGLINLGSPRIASFRVPGLIREARVTDPWMKHRERLAPSYDRVRVPLARGLTILVVRVDRSPLVGLRRMIGHGVPQA